MMYDAQLYLINARKAQFAIINEVPFMPLDPPKIIWLIDYMWNSTHAVAYGYSSKIERI